MSSPPKAAADSQRSIAEVERDTQLPRATLRIWERRYGFPAPTRDARGERSYPGSQVEQLRQVRALLDLGHRPAKLLAGGAAGLLRLSQSLPGGASAGPAAPATRAKPDARLLKLLRAHDAPALRAELEARLRRAGLAAFACVDMPAMNAMVGNAWSAGEIQIHEEHLYSDCVAEVVRAALRPLAIAPRPEAPRVLLTTFPNEHHALGLLMAQAIFTLQGCPVVPLGVRLPVAQIVAAAQAHRADLIGLSFTPSLNAAQVLRSLDDLRSQLPVHVRVWAGGVNAALAGRPIRGVRIVQDAAAIPHFLAEDFALPPLGPLVEC